MLHVLMSLKKTFNVQIHHPSCYNYKILESIEKKMYAFSFLLEIPIIFRINRFSFPIKVRCNVVVHWLTSKGKSLALWARLLMASNFIIFLKNETNVGQYL